MKKLVKISVSLILVLFCVLSAVSAYATDYTDAPYVTVVIDGTTLDFSGDQGPVISGGRTLLPVRKILEALNASVFWDGDTRSVFSAKGEISIALQIDSPALFRNTKDISQQLTLDVPPMIINDRTMLPARAVAEAYGASVSWDGTTNTVTIISK